MNKKLNAANSSDTRLIIPPQVTFVLEVTGLFLVWWFLMFREHTAASSFIENIADVTQFVGGIIVVIFACRAQGLTAFIRTFVYGATTIILLPVIIGGLSDTINQASDENPLFAVVVIIVCCGMVSAVCNLFTSDDPVSDVTSARAPLQAGRPAPFSRRTDASSLPTKRATR